VKRTRSGLPGTIVLILAAVVVGYFVLLAAKAFAGQATLTWVPPTQNCDGTPLTNLTGYALLYGQGKAQLPLSPQSYVVKGLTPGEWWFTIAAVTPTAQSQFISVSKTIVPGEFAAVGGPALTLVKKQDGFLLLPVGTVPAGTVCMADQTINGYYVVPRAAVTWSGTVKPDVVVAQCQ
jgi:hypothetical protein